MAGSLASAARVLHSAPPGNNWSLGSSSRRRRFVVALVVALLLLGPLGSTGPLRVPQAAASNLTITPSGPVSVEFTFKSADFINTVAVTAPVNQTLFNTQQSRLGTRVELGTFAAGTTFVFQLQATTSSGSFTWSSDPTQNSDGQDHMRVTEQYNGDATLDNRVYKLEWEDDINLGDGDFNDAVAILRIGGDTDGDGIPDDSERFGIDADNDGDVTDPGEQDLQNGIDQNGNGTIESNERADPRHKDIFIEMDWMDCATAGGDCAAGDTHSHRPQAQAVTNLVQAFANHPSVNNPDGTNGINVHVDVSNVVPHQNVLNFNGGPLGCSSGTAGSGFGDFDTVKAANFNNASVRRFAYHYALFIHVENQAALTNNLQRFSGCGETPGNDFYISFGLWGAGVPSVLQESGTVMHELGHNLGLQHGGNEATVNNKPNYLSVMNYSFQLVGILTGNRLDYSRSVLAMLNEASLNEALGIQDGTDTTRFFCPGQTTLTQGAGTGTINWDCDTTIPDPNPVAVDVNGAGGQTNLTGFNDWPTVLQNLEFQNGSGFQDGEHPSAILPPEELDLQTSLDQRLLTPPPDLAPVGPKSGVYSDPITAFTLTASDSDSSCADLTFSATGLPAGLAVTNNGDCTATVSGTIGSAAGTYPVIYKVTDEAGNSDSEVSAITVAREDALAAPSAANPAAVQVNSPGGTAGPITLQAAVSEVADGSDGNISLATPVTYTLTPVGAGPSYSCTATTSGGGVGGVLQTTCTFSGVAVNVYDVHIAVGGDFYQGSADTVLTVFDPSLGFVTGGAVLLHDGVQADAGFTAKYLKKGQLKGSLLFIEHRPTGDVVLKSNAMGSMAIVGSTAYILGKATLNGVGNYSFRATVVDNGEPGTNDQFGLQVKNLSGAIVVDLTFSRITLTTGNIVVPHPG
jgi:hypothetical protein